MEKKKSTFGIGTFLLFSILFLIGCNEMNRKHFTRLEPGKIENGNQHFKYQASAGVSGQTCAPGSRTCRIDNSRRAAIWPLEDKEAEKTRMEWLKKSLAENGYQNAEYEIASRQLILTNSMYDVCYDVKVKLQ